MRKFFKKIHLWISVPAGLVISITCLTGAILVFEKEILALAHPQLYRCEVPEGSGMMSREEIAQSLSSIYVPGIEGQAEVSSGDIQGRRKKNFERKPLYRRNQRLGREKRIFHHSTATAQVDAGCP